jgi:uncharacterized tellurite resistance protein B-like protein
LYLPRNSGEDDDGNVTLREKEYFLELIQEEFGITRAPAEQVMMEIMECIRRKEMVRINRSVFI